MDDARLEDEERDLIMHNLNILAVDNYEEIKVNLIKIVYDKKENCEKFVDIIFEKVLFGKSFVFLYAKLCKDLDREGIREGI